MSAAHPLPVFLPWDTEFFGVRIARLMAHGLDEAGWRAALEWSRKERIRCLYLLTNASDREQHARSEAAGALRLDERTTLWVPIPPAVQGAPDSEIRLAVEADLPALRELAAASHQNTRFWKDPGFARERCAALYALWIERDLKERSVVFVTGAVGAPLGYATVNFENDKATIGLLAVSPLTRRQGFGRRLMSRAFDLIREKGHERAGYVTQGPDNIALKLYESLGSRVERLETWHHIWFPSKA